MPWTYPAPPAAGKFACTLEVDPRARQKRIRAMSAAQLTAFLDALKGAPTVYGALLATMARSGLRPGEAFALPPHDLDILGRKIHVERALSDGRLGTPRPARAARWT